VLNVPLYFGLLSTETDADLRMFPVSGRYSKTLYCRITFGYDVMWITVLIIVIVLGLGIGPVMWLMPSARQKQLAALRAHAATQGLKVRLVSVGQLGSVNLAAGERKFIAYYMLPWDFAQAIEKTLSKQDTFTDWTLVNGKMPHEGNFSGHWDWLEDQYSLQNWGALRTFVQGLSDDFVSCECSRQGVAIGWLERGDKARVDEVKQLLITLKQLCVTRFAPSVVE